jgi:hypothetical protein
MGDSQEIVPLLMVQQFGLVRFFPLERQYDEMLEICEKHNFTEVYHWPDTDRTYWKTSCHESWVRN